MNDNVEWGNRHNEEIRNLRRILQEGSGKVEAGGKVSRRSRGKIVGQNGGYHSHENDNRSGG